MTTATITCQDPTIEGLIAANREFTELTGSAAYLYATEPAPTAATRFVFSDLTVLGAERARAHMAELLAAAKSMDDGRLWWCWA